MTKLTRFPIIGFIAVLLMGLIISPYQAFAEETDKPWLNKELSPAKRANLLVEAMSLEDKIKLITGNLNNYYGYYNEGMEQYGIPELKMADGPAGVRIANPDIQNKQSTAMPAPIALAATWDTEAAASYGNILGNEAFNTTHNVLLGPGLDIARNAFGSRNFESLGEDPLLQSKMAASYINAVQDNNVMVTAKHYLLNNQETLRFTNDSQASERAIHEIYARPFEAAIEDADLSSVMCAFNEVNSVYACDNEDLLTGLLRDQLDFKGFVMSDYGANRTTADSINAGLDLETPGEPDGQWGDKLLQAVKDGQVSVETINQSASRLLYQMFDKGLFEYPTQNQQIDTAAHGQTAREIAAESMVLLKNKKDALPIQDDADSIAVIGPDADNASAAGGGSSLVNPTYTVSPLDGIKNHAGKNTDVSYTAGTDPISAGDVMSGPDAVPSSLLHPTEDAAENGLKAEYWSNKNFEGNPVHESTDRQVNVNLGFYNYDGLNAQSPKLDRLPGDLNSMMSARWTGYIEAPKDGTYKLSTTSYGTSKLYLDDKLIVDNKGEELGTKSAEVKLKKGERHAVEIEYKSDYETGDGRDYGGQVRFGWEPAKGAVDEQIQEAVKAAKKADKAVIVTRTYDSEGYTERSDMELPNNQQQLIKEVSKVNPNTIVVNESGIAIEMGDWQKDVKAIVQAWYPGQEQGNAIADVLFGDVNPSGKLPVTFPVDEDSTPINTEAQFPGTNGVNDYAEGIFVGYRGYDKQNLDAAYPFGYGLSYTDFNYRNLHTKVKHRKDETSMEVKLNLRNTGDTKGAEVVQVYAGKLPAKSVETPEKQLAGFEKVELAPGKQTSVKIKLDPKAFSYYDEDKEEWVMPSGKVHVYVGSSSEDIRLQGTVTLP
ncbi:glycoside hydrolase family 3 C-terminal domain-containing protein [Terribacillus saccharophilus]|uniref:glycoside hydrolase family 3 C-terminal domain-containing protein n=1 Tax=Terribacillus saccharophilus TaxID=361277 RepID=UPI003981C235